MESTRKKRSQKPGQRANQEHTASCQDCCQLTVEEAADIHAGAWTCQIESLLRSWNDTISKAMVNLTVLMEKPCYAHDLAIGMLECAVGQQD